MRHFVPGRTPIVPRLSGQRLAGVAGLLALLTLSSSALPSLHAPRVPKPSAALGPGSAQPAPVSAAGSEQPVPSDAPPAERFPALEPRPGNRAPVIRRAEFGSPRATALGDLRLQIEAHDPDGDPVYIRTRWQVDDREFETPTPVLPRIHLSRGATVRAWVIAVDGSNESPPYSTRTLVVENAPPTITTFPRGFDATGAFVYPLGAVDADGDRSLEFVLIEGPAGMRIEAHEGTVTWLPNADQIGRHPVRIEVRDGRGGRESQVFVLRVQRSASEARDLANR
jgi:hypothetical protein